MKRLIAHLCGDYVLQNDWMANAKTREHGPAALHGAIYAACFLPLTRDPRALAVIGGTHAVIDRYRLARYLVWARNQIAPPAARYRLATAGPFGQHGAPDISGGMREVMNLSGPDLILDDRDEYERRVVAATERLPQIYRLDWLHGWLMFLADNTVHMLVNEWALDRWSR